MLDKTKRYLVVGLGLLGGKYALELTKAGFHVDGINRSEGHLQYALDHGYIASGKTHDFEDLVQQADHIIFGLYPTALLEWFKAYGPLLKPGCIFTDVSGVKTGLVEPVQAMCPAGVEFIASHPMAGRETSSVEHAAEGIVVVASPQELVSMIVAKAVNMAEMMKVPMLGIVENMSYIVCPDCGKHINVFGNSHVDEVAAKHHLPVLAKCPIDPKLAELSDAGMIETYGGEYLEGAADACEKLLK